MEEQRDAFAGPGREGPGRPSFEDVLADRFVCGEINGDEEFRDSCDSSASGEARRSDEG